VFCDDGRVMDEKKRWGMKMGTMWRIQADMNNQGYDFPEWVGTTSYRCYYTPDQDLYLPYQGWSIDSHRKFSEVPVSHQ